MTFAAGIYYVTIRDSDRNYELQTHDRDFAASLDYCESLIEI